MAVTEINLKLQDAQGMVAKTKAYLDTAITDPGAADIDTLVTDLQAMTTAKVVDQSISIADFTEVAATGTGDDFENAVDKLLVTLRSTTTRKLYKYLIPCPATTSADGAVFLNDHVTADPANAQVAALKTALETYAVGRAGEALEWVGAVRAYKRRKSSNRAAPAPIV